MPSEGEAAGFHEARTVSLPPAGEAPAADVRVAFAGRTHVGKARLLREAPERADRKLIEDGENDPALKGLDPKLTGEANVHWTPADVADNPESKKALEEKRFETAGTAYDLETGAARFLS